MLFGSLALQAQEEKKNTLQVFPKGRWFKPLYLDPLDAQVFGSIASISQNKSPFGFDKSFLPFGIGGYKAILRNDGDKKWEWGAEFLVVTQFEWDKNAIGTGRTMLGVDYKVASNLTYMVKEDFALRIRLYHLSAHWGDDFIILNNISTFDSAKLYNYNQFDVVGQWYKKKLRYYAGIGLIPFQDVDFDGLSFQAGAYYSHHKSDILRYIAGIDTKYYDYFDFRPQVKAAIGIELGNLNKSQNIRFMIEYFNGHRPYLSYENPEPVQWLGLGTSFNL